LIEFIRESAGLDLQADDRRVEVLSEVGVERDLQRLRNLLLGVEELVRVVAGGHLADQVRCHVEVHAAVVRPQRILVFRIETFLLSRQAVWTWRALHSPADH